jgi:hypothetical protein
MAGEHIGNAASRQFAVFAHQRKPILHGFGKVLDVVRGVLEGRAGDHGAGEWDRRRRATNQP